MFHIPKKELNHIFNFIYLVAGALAPNGTFKLSSIDRGYDDRPISFWDDSICTLCVAPHFPDRLSEYLPDLLLYLTMTVTAPANLT